MLLRGCQQQPRTVDTRGHDVVVGIQGQSHGAMDHQVHTLHRFFHGFGIPDITRDDLDAILAVGVVEFGEVQRADIDSLVQQIPDEVDARKS